MDDTNPFPSHSDVRWESIARAKKAALLDSIPAAWRLKPGAVPSVAQLRDVSEHIGQYLDLHEREITNKPAADILANIQAGEWTSLEATRAFCHRAAVAHQLTNCLSEICFEDAEKRARELDDILFRSGQRVGPLHGLPVSLKDRFHLDGFDSACGYVSWLGRKKSSDDEGTLVKKLRQLGAVLIVKTNVPMSMLMGETGNNIIGTTINPFNRELSAGGASGGEGALLALKGAPLGWGSDIAGSIRIPCAFNNLFGLRPSLGRLPTSGMATSLTGLPTAGGVVGPMAAALPSLLMATKAILDSIPWNDDCDVIEMPWRDEKLQSIRSRSCRREEKNGKLVFAVMKCDGTVMPHPPVQRAVQLVTDALLARGYEVIEWNPPLHNTGVNILVSKQTGMMDSQLNISSNDEDDQFQIFGSTAGREVRMAIDASGEPPVHQLRSWYTDDHQQASSTAEFWDLCHQRDQFRAQYNKYWISTRENTRSKRQVDGVIMPVAPTAAVKEGQFAYYAYSAIVNVLDYSAGSFPVTFADRFLDTEQPNYEPMNSVDRSVWLTYNKDLFDGAPVGLQVMGKRLQEEKVIGLMEAVSNALEDYQNSQPETVPSPY